MDILWIRLIWNPIPAPYLVAMWPWEGGIASLWHCLSLYKIEMMPKVVPKQGCSEDETWSCIYNTQHGPDTCLQDHRLHSFLLLLWLERTHIYYFTVAGRKFDLGLVTWPSRCLPGCITFWRLPRDLLPCSFGLLAELRPHGLAVNPCFLAGCRPRAVPSFQRLLRTWLVTLLPYLQGQQWRVESFSHHMPDQFSCFPLFN